MNQLIKQLDVENVPFEEVLAFSNDDHFLVGHLSYNDKIDNTVCESDTEVLNNVISYITIEDLKKLFKENEG